MLLQSFNSNNMKWKISNTCPCVFLLSLSCNLVYASYFFSCYLFLSLSFFQHLFFYPFFILPFSHPQLKIFPSKFLSQTYTYKHRLNLCYLKSEQTECMRSQKKIIQYGKLLDVEILNPMSYKRTERKGRYTTGSKWLSYF